MKWSAVAVSDKSKVYFWIKLKTSAHCERLSDMMCLYNGTRGEVLCPPPPSVPPLPPVVPGISNSISSGSTLLGVDFSFSLLLTKPVTKESCNMQLDQIRWVNHTKIFSFQRLISLIHCLPFDLALWTASRWLGKRRNDRSSLWK